MRTFGSPAANEIKTKIRRQTKELYDSIPLKRPVRGGDFAMDNEQDVVLYEVDLKLSDGQRLRIAETLPSARPPFEWLMELTSDIGEADYFKHYLMLEDDIVIAERKTLIPIDAEEAQVILHDLAAVRTALDNGDLKVTRKRRLA